MLLTYMLLLLLLVEDDDEEEEAGNAEGENFEDEWDRMSSLTSSIVVCHLTLMGIISCSFLFSLLDISLILMLKKVLDDID